jgi:hypothetical protein
MSIKTPCRQTPGKGRLKIEAGRYLSMNAGAWLGQKDACGIRIDDNRRQCGNDLA